jgi:hypothetical protein
MSRQLFEQMYLASQWLMTVQSQQSFALSMSGMCSSEFADLILDATRKHTEQTPPHTPDMLALRQRQASALTSKISALAYADSMSRMARAAAGEILPAAREFCAADLPKTEAEFQHAQRAAGEFTEQVSKHCFAAWSPQI